ncbi:MAG: Asp-tRNA(Asn)/Glu-tRNA(Gln) amidotransferase subunit GatA [Bifidobacteriaceae bacterium]|jgi:aspartyl-tRNA(Asn)/glutamyl-tRNA(Gln) amidotransferase subunit A|nr:Asp-tRNA(Asn)/Glu-tRNA(Gln) amidotransferase subunit GatA [Bifidobacteriaceae bacterium]
MSELYKLSAWEIANKLRLREISSLEITQAFLDRINQTDDKLGAFLLVDDKIAIETAKKIDSSRLKGDTLPKMAGVPIAIKDLICTKGLVTTAASKILQNWVPPYDATLVENIKDNGLIILGKTNLDEFAMGSSTERSAYKLCLNPWDLNTVPGGSSGGSAASVAAWQTPFSVGTDTGGSIRQPASLTGIVGAKPTYGGISRYGIIAMASSLDQAGPMARCVLDAAILHDILSSYDMQDSTSLNYDFGSMEQAAIEGTNQGLKGLKVGIIKQLTGEGFSKGILAAFNKVVALLVNNGAEIVEVDCPNFQYSIGAYQILMASEASSNLARYDGMRYGKRFLPDKQTVTAESMMKTTRDIGFGFEVKRRIILGTYALSAGSYEAYYGAAQKVRTLIKGDFTRAYKQVDCLISPTVPTVAFKIGEQLDDPMAMYMNDLATIPANFGGMPAMSIPNGLAANNLPSGLQIIAPQFKDYNMYFLASALEKLINFNFNPSGLTQLSKAVNL